MGSATKVTITRSQCGTKSGYQLHRRRREVACDACKAANAAHRRDCWTNTASRSAVRGRAERRAMARLKAMNPAVWRSLLREELWRIESGGRSDG